MTYNDLINAFNARDEERANLQTYGQITDHRKTKKGEWEVKVLWDTGDETWEPMRVICQKYRVFWEQVMNWVHGDTLGKQD